MTKYLVEGMCISEDGSFSLGKVEIEAEDEGGVEHKAWLELWDGRLSAASCSFGIHIHDEWEEDDD